jgi:hypothetical protein
MIIIICILLTILLFYIDNKKNEERYRESNQKTFEKLRQKQETEQSNREFMIRYKDARDSFAKMTDGPDKIRFQYHTPSEIKKFKEKEIREREEKEKEENKKHEGQHLNPEELKEFFQEMGRISKLKRDNITEYNKLRNIKQR